MGRGLPPSVRRHGVRVGRVTARSVHSLKSAQVSGIHCVHGAVPPPPLARPSFIPLGSHSHPPPRPWRPLVCCFWGSLSGHWARGKSWRVAFTPGVTARWLGGPTLLRCPGTLRSAGAPAGGQHGREDAVSAALRVGAHSSCRPGGRPRSRCHEGCHRGRPRAGLRRTVAPCAPAVCEGPHVSGRHVVSRLWSAVRVCAGVPPPF